MYSEKDTKPVVLLAEFAMTIQIQSKWVYSV